MSKPINQNIAAFKKPEVVAAEINHDLVAKLEILLDDARRGDSVGAIFASFKKGGAIDTYVSIPVTVSIASAMGAGELLRSDLHKAFMEN